MIYYEIYASNRSPWGMDRPSVFTYFPGSHSAPSGKHRSPDSRTEFR
jgi:hypothetical protein